VLETAVQEESLKGTGAPAAGKLWFNMQRNLLKLVNRLLRLKMICLGLAEIRMCLIWSLGGKERERLQEKRFLLI
jgi:hypothetical protein